MWTVLNNVVNIWHDSLAQFLNGIVVHFVETVILVGFQGDSKSINFNV